MSSTEHPVMGSVIVTGGCGFLGYALVQQLLDDPECGPVHVVDRTVSQNCHNGAEYHEVDINNRAVMEKLFQVTKPTVVFNLASPNFSYPTHGTSDFYQTNIKGTEMLLQLAADCDHTKAFVHTSSVDIYADAPHVNISETHKIHASSREDPYAYTKAVADGLVLAANSPSLRTVSLRMSHMYGVRCSQQLRALLDVCAGNGPLFRLGPGTNMLEVVSSDNAAAANIVAAKALIDPSRSKGKVDGEAFNISDGKAVLYWYHTALFWSAARGRSVNDELIEIPAWLTRLIWGFIIWMYWIFTLGYVRPPAMFSTTALSYSLDHHTYSPEKARQRLGFQPVSNHDEIVREAVTEELRRRESSKSIKGA